MPPTPNLPANPQPNEYLTLDDYPQELSHIPADHSTPTHFTAHSHMASTTIDTITSLLPAQTRLLHVELVLRADLRRRYLAMRRRIRRVRDMRERCGILESMNDDDDDDAKERQREGEGGDGYGSVEEEVVFYAADRGDVARIVREGFEVPWDDMEKYREKRLDMPWGMGVYTYPDPNDALYHADPAPPAPDSKPSTTHSLLPSQKLLVCSILPGRQYHYHPQNPYDDPYGSDPDSDTPPAPEGLKHDFDTHISPTQSTYVVFHSAQLLPLYVLHLGDRFAAAAVRARRVRREREGGKENGRERDVKGYVGKRMPFGFGCVGVNGDGGGGVGGEWEGVEVEMADVDEDEERWMCAGDELLDEFQEFRFGGARG